ncbi:MAG: hypothetical protein DHS20C18_38850 [Saprospiraceae bacterium]|nr:MAG: hypothetical protein DHS20C18_38850 [Saprospiraceae bacterium]
MKKIVLSLSFCLAVLALSAQATIDQQAVQQATDELTALYQLDAQQTPKMQIIQERLFRNLAEIEVLKDQQPILYLEKKKNIRRGMEASIKMMLTTDQMAIFNQQLVERRKKESDKIKNLKAEGASKEAIQMALLEIE